MFADDSNYAYWLENLAGLEQAFVCRVYALCLIMSLPGDRQAFDPGWPSRRRGQRRRRCGRSGCADCWIRLVWSAVSSGEFRAGPKRETSYRESSVNR